MTNKYTNELYEKIKNSFAETKRSGFKNILKTKPENTYIVRLIPNVNNPEKTFFKYFQHGWNNTSDGQYVSAICPSTYEEECPICSERFRLWNKGDESSKELSKNLARKERYYANVYVVDDPENPENNGTVKIFGYGRQIAKIIDEAMNGDDAGDIGHRMFDFSKEGCNLRIKVEKNKANYPNYDRSKFLPPSALPVTLDDVASQIHDFDDLINRTPTEELKRMVESGLYGITPQASSNDADAYKPVTGPKTPVAQKVQAIVDDIPMEFEHSDMDEDILAGLEELSTL